MKKIILLLMVMIGLAGAVEPIQISGKDFSDFEQFNGTNAMQSEDLSGTSAAMMGIDTSFLVDNEDDGKPINQIKPTLLVGSMVRYQRQDTKFYTPAELEIKMIGVDSL